MDQEEISLREIIETIWHGKYLIVIITILAMLGSGIFSFFMLDPVYEASSLVRSMNKFDADAGNTNPDLNSYTKTIKSNAAMNRVIEKLKLDKTQYSVGRIKKMVTVTPIKDTNVLEIVVKGTNPQLIANIANLLAFELGARIEISDRSAKIVNYKNRLLEIESSIEITQGEIHEAKEQLKTVPEKLVTKKSLSSDAYLQSIAGETSNLDSKDLGAVQFNEEEINPVFLELQSSISTAYLNLSKLIAEQKSNNKMIEQNQQKITELENQMDEASIKAQSSQRLLSGLQAVFINPALTPEEPVGPRKMLNVAIAAVLGVMMSVFIVFIRQYWKDTGTEAYGNSVTS